MMKSSALFCTAIYDEHKHVAAYFSKTSYNIFFWDIQNTFNTHNYIVSTDQQHTCASETDSLKVIIKHFCE